MVKSIRSDLLETKSFFKLIKNTNESRIRSHNNNIIEKYDVVAINFKKKMYKQTYIFYNCYCLNDKFYVRGLLKANNNCDYNAKLSFLNHMDLLRDPETFKDLFDLSDYVFIDSYEPYKSDVVKKTRSSNYAMSNKFHDDLTNQFKTQEPEPVKEPVKDPVKDQDQDQEKNQDQDQDQEQVKEPEVKKYDNKYDLLFSFDKTLNCKITDKQDNIIELKDVFNHFCTIAFTLRSIWINHTKKQFGIEYQVTSIKRKK